MKSRREKQIKTERGSRRDRQIRRDYKPEM